VIRLSMSRSVQQTPCLCHGRGTLPRVLWPSISTVCVRGFGVVTGSFPPHSSVISLLCIRPGVVNYEIRYAAFVYSPVVFPNPLSASFDGLLIRGVPARSGYSPV